MKTTVKYMVSFAATIFFGLIANRINSNSLDLSIDQVVFESLVLIISFAIPNLIFLWIMDKLGFLQPFFLKKSWIILEVIFLYAIFYLTEMLIEALPATIKFSTTNNLKTTRIYFEFYFELLYSFIVLFILLWCYRKLGNVSK